MRKTIFQIKRDDKLSVFNLFHPPKVWMQNYEMFVVNMGKEISDKNKFYNKT